MRFLRSIFVPEDDACFFLYEGPSARVGAGRGDAGELGVARVDAALRIHPDEKETSWTCRAWQSMPHRARGASRSSSRRPWLALVGGTGGAPGGRRHVPHHRRRQPDRGWAAGQRRDRPDLDDQLSATGTLVSAPPGAVGTADYELEAGPGVVRAKIDGSFSGPVRASTTPSPPDAGGLDDRAHDQRAAGRVRQHRR